MGAGHGHGHGGGTAAGAHRNRLALVLGITTTILIVEVIGGLVSGSLALLADAGHMLTDATGVALTLLAIWVAQRPPSSRRTFGFQRAEVLAALVNAVLLLGVGGFVVVEGIRRLIEPPEVGTTAMIVFGLIGMVANAISLLILSRAQSESIGIRGAFLEVMSDALGSAAVVVAAIVIALTGWERADAIASLGIGLLIVPRTLKLLKEAVEVLLEATPKGVDLDDVRKHLCETPGVLEVHDLHAWTITSGAPVLSAHIVVADERLECGSGTVLDALQRCVAGHFDVEHSTFQLEVVGHADHEPGSHS
jgi:cobalt-zinc-cadmium efflux system protein